MHRDAPLPDPDGDMDGALEQMSTFADAAAKTSADEEIYGSSLTGQQGPTSLPGPLAKPPCPQNRHAPCWPMHTCTAAACGWAVITRSSSLPVQEQTPRVWSRDE